jgi:uncharacterized repeat protein (TIGR03803 family)
MLKPWLFLATYLLLSLNVVQAQTKLFGMTSFGGNANAGTIYSVNTDGSGFSKIHDFDGANGNHPQGALVVLPDGKLAGITVHGGSDGKGVLFKLNDDGTEYSVIKHFTDTRPSKGILLGSDGMLYGATSSTLTKGGVVYRINPDGTGYTELKHFEVLPFDLEDSPSSMIELPDGSLRGVTYYGTNGFGFVYAINKDGSNYSVLLDSEFNTGAHPIGILYATDGRLYITYQAGGNTEVFEGGYGSIVSMNIDGTDVKELFGWTNAQGAIGKYPHWGVTEGAEGELYGTTIWHGDGDININKGGIVFKINKDGSGYTPLYYGNESSSNQPMYGVTIGNDGRIFTAFTSGGEFNGGTVAALDNNGENFAVLKNFDDESGKVPGAGLLTLVNKVQLYSIKGLVTKPGDVNLKTGWAKLFYEQGGLAAKTEVIEGNFEINLLPPGNYILQIVPLGTEGSAVFSTYYKSAHVHSQADVITLDESLTVNLEMIGKSNAGNAKGNGVIKGKVSSLATGGRNMEAKGVESIPVYLLDEATKTVMRSMVTDSEGYFEMNDISSGKYLFALDLVGTSLESTSALLNFNENAGFIEINAIMNDKDVDITMNIVTGIKESEALISTSPNPVNDILAIELGSEGINKFSGLQLFSAEGKKVQNLHVTTVNDKALLNVSELHAGLYLLIIQIDSHYSVVKFIKE